MAWRGHTERQGSWLTVPHPLREKAVVEYALRMCERGFPVPIKFLGTIAQIFKRQRSSAFQTHCCRRWYPCTGQELATRLLQASP